VINIIRHCKKIKKRQLWLPELYRQKYSSNVIGFTDFRVMNHILLSDIMLIYHPIEVLISVLDHCNTLTINNHGRDESHDHSNLVRSRFSTRDN